MTDVVQVCETRAFPAGPLFTRQIDALSRDELLIDGTRILTRRNATGHVEPVAMPQILHGHLLNESLDRSRFTTILHTANNCVPHVSTFTATTKGDCLRHNPKACETSFLCNEASSDPQRQNASTARRSSSVGSRPRPST